MNENRKLRYGSIDGIRAFAAIGIVMMHMGANNNYEIKGNLFEEVIPFFTNFVYLFMIVSAFSVCCGYYEKMVANSSTIMTFYKKRYSKILPFFSLLVLIDLIMEHSVQALIESFADLTLVFGLLPNANISVIGVGWFLGTVFVFYLTFPFFCFLMENKKRAWLAMGISVLYNFVCVIYFCDSAHVLEGTSKRTNFMFSSMFFMAGCMIYLYRESIIEYIKKVRWIYSSIIVLVTIGYFVISKKEFINNFYMLILFGLWLIYAISFDSKILHNKFTTFISGISLEIYLCHMLIFRVIEKLHLNYLLGKGWLSYILTVGIVCCGAIIFSLMAQKIFGLIRRSEN